MSQRYPGVVRSFRGGTGFITLYGHPHLTGRDVFVHYSNIVCEGYRVLDDGEQVTFRLVQTDRGLAALEVKRQKRPESRPYHNGHSELH